MMSNLTLTCQVSWELITILVLHDNTFFPILYAWWFRFSPPSSFFFYYSSDYVWMDVLWPVDISIGRLTRFIIQIYPSTICAQFFILFFCFLFFTSLRVCMYVRVCAWVSFDALKNGSKRTYKQRQNKKNETQKK